MKMIDIGPEQPDNLTTKGQTEAGLPLCPKTNPAWIDPLQNQSRGDPGLLLHQRVSASWIRLMARISAALARI